MKDKIIDGNQLRALRSAKGWDQNTVAQKSGIDPSVISRLERGLQTDLKASVLIALARTLDTPIESLLAQEYHRDTSTLPTDLERAVASLERLTEQQKRQVTAILWAYVETLN